ncbi:carboxyvinyl-carboxyphosphonate phosphorylmutase [Acuticoccus sediminis]|uniref:Carboxyvinyl-carboxyphosphonate phosphorylmutase n=1 Tax=Acuticoccus sediminis TaxID=2184697 RepID=A0A8B2NK49_9HYPH|nr:isocitrate lyase/PEP mutase family protein [Acuticoccus sediminis]RAH98867.1 carboxyvinyl-carboxyphosphonate phosphorylmutase [Acuticoccus sediminis]
MGSDHARSLKQAVAERRALLVPGVMNALAARVADDMGFEALYVTGAGVTNAYLGLPDVAFLTLTQLADHVAAIRNITDKPLLVDGDTGFGNAVNVWHTVRTLEQAGASAIQLEDQDFPKRCGHFDGKSVITAAEMEQKVRSAVDARRDENLQIIARTDAYAIHGLDAAVERAERYVAAGADIVFVEAPKRPEEIGEIVRRVSAPHLVNMVIGGKTPPMSYEDLSAAGAAIVLYANASLQGAILGMQTALGQLRTTKVISEADGVVAPFSERQRLVGKDLVDEMDTRYGVAADAS